MARRRLLLLLKPFDVLPTHHFDHISHFRNPKEAMDMASPWAKLLGLSKNAAVSMSDPPQMDYFWRMIHTRGEFEQHRLRLLQVLKYLDNRRLVHKEAINFCQNILRKKLVDWEAVYRFNLSREIRDVDLVVTIGGDGTLLQASHFMDNSIPVLGVNSDPTQAKEVEECSEDFDATRSTGYLCAATVNNFEQIIDDILENRARPSEVSRMSVTLNSKQLSPYALNDVLIAHPCPATVSRFSFRTKKKDQSFSSLVHCRSSGLRVSAAAGSTAAMLSAGGFAMPILSEDLQYIVREPIAPGAYNSLMHGTVKPEELMEIAWYCKEGLIYIDGAHLIHSVQHGDIIELSSKAPRLKVFLPPHLIS